MAQTDRNAGLVANAGIKHPCLAATTADITLSGEQTLDGVAVVTGNRVLVKDQTNQVENGLYEVDSSTWTRAKDSNGAYDLVKGTLVWVYGGSTQNGFYYVTSADVITVGTDAITWAAASSTLAVISAFMQTLVDDTSALAGKQTLLLDKSGADIISAGTVDLDAATGDHIDITGTTNITAFTLADGQEKTVRFTGSLLLTHSASLVLRGEVNITTAAGDYGVFRGDSGSVVRMVDYQRLQEHGSDVVSATTTDLDATTGELIDITGNTAITGITLTEGQVRTVRFTGILTLTNGASLVLPGEADITTAVGDFAVFRGYAAGVVRVVTYSRFSGASVVGTAVGDVVGDMLESMSATRTGWLLMRGQTLGSLASAGDDASASYEALFTYLWDNLGDGEAAVSGGRGVSAFADWGANKTIVIPDRRGRVALGKDNMGGTPANVVTGTEADTVGNVGGSESSTLVAANLPPHTHTYLGVAAGGLSGGGGGAGIIKPTGDGSPTLASVPFTTVSPYFTVNVFIKW